MKRACSTIIVLLMVGLLMACERRVDPTPTVPPDPLASLIAIEGDLDSPYRFRSDPMPWRIYPGIPSTPMVYYYEILEGSSEANEEGHVTVVRYYSPAQATTAYAAIRDEAELGKQVSWLALGDAGSQSGPSSDWNTSDVLFRICNTVVHLSLTGPKLDALLAYAQRLHDRIKPVVCAE